VRRALIPWGDGSNFAPSATGLLIRGQGCLTSFVVRNVASGAAVHVVLYDGASANKETLLDIEIAASGTYSETWVPHAFPYLQGLWVVCGATTVVGSAMAWADHSCESWLQAEHVTIELSGAEALAQLGGRS
jgi:hypothetical protein